MDEILQIIAILVILGASAASSLAKKFNQDQNDKLDEPPVEPPVPAPKRPLRPAPRPQSQETKPMASTDGHSLEGRSLEGRSLETRPQRMRKPIQKRRPIQERPKPQPQPDEVLVETLPQAEKEKDLVTEIFKAFMETEEPEIVMEPEPPKPKKAPKPQPKKESVKKKPVEKPALSPMELARLTSPTKSHHRLFTQLAKQAEVNPLRVAVVLSEVLRRPRSLPPIPRWSERQ